MFKADDVGATECYASINTGVGVRVQQYGISGAGQCGTHTHRGRVAGGEDDGVLYPIKLGDFIFQKLMLCEGTVGQP